LIYILKTLTLKQGLQQSTVIADPSIKELSLIITRFIAWIDPVQERDRWWAPANAAKNLRVLIKCGEFLD
jgi:hypothetical protein